MGWYRKIDSRIRNDRKVRALSDDGRLLWYDLMAHQGLTAIGAMRHTIPGLAAESGWTVERMRNAFNELDADMVVIDESASFIWLRNFLKYNEPSGPNSTAAWVSALDMIPECDARDELIAECRAYLLSTTEQFRSRLTPAVVETFGLGEQKPKKTKRPRTRDAKPDAITDAKPDAKPDPSPTLEQDPEPELEQELEQKKKDKLAAPAAPTAAGAPPEGGKGHRDRWLTPYALIWQERMGIFHFAKAAAFLRPLEREIGVEETQRRFRLYCADTPPEHASVARFAETHRRYEHGTSRTGAATAPRDSGPTQPEDRYARSRARMHAILGGSGEG